MREKFTPQKIKFLKDNAIKYETKVLADLYNKKFNVNLSVDAIRIYLQRHNILYKKHVIMKYTQEMINYLKKYSQKYGSKDLTILFNKKFKMNVTTKKIILVLIYHKIDYIKKCTPTRYTPEMIDFIRNNALMHYTRDIASLFNKKFNAAVTANDIRRVLYNYNIPFIKNNTRYKNSFTYPIGQEIVNVKNDTYIKISNEGKKNEKWVKKQNIIWEKNNGKIPKGYCVIFLDGNKSNFELDNLELVKITEYRLFIKHGFNFNNKKLTRASLAVFKHKSLILETLTKGMNKEERQATLNRLYGKIRRAKKKERLKNAN